MDILRAGQRPSSKGPEAYFTGSVRIDPIIEAPGPARGRAVTVTFEPGARTAWHTHPLGQTILIVSGLCHAQRRGGPVETLRPGDVAWFAPGEEHWHGAAPDCGMAHIAMQEALDGKTVDWLAKVSDAEYRGGA